MFKLRKALDSHRNTDDTLRQAMGRLYNNQQARELLRQRLNGRDIESLTDEAIYTLVRDVVRDLQRKGLVPA